MESDDGLQAAPQKPAAAAPSQRSLILGEPSAENGRTPPRSTVHKRLPSAMEDSPTGSVEAQREARAMETDEPTLAEAPLKLQVSATEDEEDGSEELNSSGELRDDSTAGEDDDEEGEETSTTKRKRYLVRRSGSEECLLGFDEESGEAELVLYDTDELLAVTPSTSASSKKKLEAQLSRDADSPLPPTAKKLKKSPNSSRASPKSQQPQVAKKPNRSPQTPVAKIEEAHIVAEDINGNAAVAPSPSATIAPVPALGTTSVKSPVSNQRQRTNNASVSPSKKPPLAAQHEYFRKPFEYGWRRELVWRANMETSKDKADVYFISPTGKKLRTRNDIVPYLEGDLTIDHFSFTREPLGAAAEFETVRSAKPSSRISVTAATLAAAPPAVAMGKRVSKPKGPKGASPPPQGWTPTRALKVNNAALLSSSHRHSSGGGGSTGGGGGSNHSTPASGRSGSHSSRPSKAKKTPTAASNNNLHAVADQAHTANSGNRSTHEPCSIMCGRAKGEVPQLQCVKCVCLYHHECVGLSRLNSEYRSLGGNAGRKDYICEACQPTTQKVDLTAQAPTVAAATTDAPPKVKATSKLATRPAVSDRKFAQTLSVIKGKKFVMVSNSHFEKNRNSHVNDIDSDLKAINESLRNNRKQSSISVDAGAQSGTPTSLLEQPNKQFATNFFANVSYAYDALICILKYLKIHERPRAASVCKLWHLAAKDTSMWHTVRMKNSKVCNWAGFTAALRRGETKHLDLRKMLVASTRGDEMWQQFSENIGTVCSMEQIDLCRCSARVVESLFQSNKQLRVLNAIAINDDTLNLEHITNLQKLEELRLRTSEPAVLAGELQPLATLHNLAHLSLTAVRGLGVKGVEILGELTQLRSLELGECGDFEDSFAEVVLPMLRQLQRLRLENGTETACCTLGILDAVAQLPQLSQLELVNFDIKPGFDERMRNCTQVTKLLIIPTYISQSATTNHTVLSAVQQVAPTLRVFTWGVTVELLRVTALYVDQCEESARKEKHHFDECIPVLKPVPGAPPADDEDELEEQARAEQQRLENEANGTPAQSDVPQIEILPLDKVESILGENLPHTKFTIVKVPYHATCKQQLVE